MPELGFDDSQRSVTRNLDFSLDSVIHTPESNFGSLFSSASASVDRCSFASDPFDQDSIVSDVSLRLAGAEISSGPDSDPNNLKLYRNYGRLRRKVEKVKAQKHDYSKEGYDQNEAVDSARNSFSHALKECQDRRLRIEALYREQDRCRPASLDLINHHVTATAASSSPYFGVMKKSSLMTRQSVTVLSPGTPNFRQASVTTQKGWSSERVPLRNNGNNRRSMNAVLYPFNNGRTLPSKWEDAERWIFSPPVSGDGVARNLIRQQPQKRPKSKSGPLGLPGIPYNSMHSPAGPMFEAGCVGTLMGGSPFSPRVIAGDGFSVCSGLGSAGAGNFAPHMSPIMARSVSIHGCSEVLARSTHAGSQEHTGELLIDTGKDASTNISRVVSRRDMATQMSPESSAQSSPRNRLSFSLTTPSSLPMVEWDNVQSSKSDVRDVQVDERVTLTRWSKRNKARFPVKVSENLNDWRRKAMELRSSSWEVSDAEKSISKIKREEAEIAAWEDLQKAKAEAAMRKLEMKLEKKRSSSMDKIMNKLRSAQKKAQEMRSSMLTNQPHQVSKTSSKVISLRRTRQISSLSGCFTCHAF